MSKKNTSTSTNVNVNAVERHERLNQMYNGFAAVGAQDVALRETKSGLCTTFLELYKHARCAEKLAQEIRKDLIDRGLWDATREQYSGALRGKAGRTFSVVRTTLITVVQHGMLSDCKSWTDVEKRYKSIRAENADRETKMARHIAQHLHKDSKTRDLCYRVLLNALSKYPDLKFNDPDELTAALKNVEFPETVAGFRVPVKDPEVRK